MRRAVLAAAVAAAVSCGCASIGGLGGSFNPARLSPGAGLFAAGPGRDIDEVDTAARGLSEPWTVAIFAANSMNESYIWGSAGPSPEGSFRGSTTGFGVRLGRGFAKGDAIVAFEVGYNWSRQDDPDHPYYGWEFYERTYTNLGARLSWNLASKVRADLSAGYALFDFNYVDSTAGSRKNSGDCFYWAIGCAYLFGGGFGLHLAYRQYTWDDTTSEWGIHEDIEDFEVGLEFFF